MSTKKRSYHTVRDFLFVIFKHQAFIVLFFLAVVICAVVASFLMTPVYEAASKLLVINAAGPVSSKDEYSLTQKAVKDEIIIDTAVEILTGRYLTEKVINEMGVKTIYPQLERKTLFGNLSKLQRAILKLKEDVTVNKGNLIEVKFQHRDPSIAARVVNKLIEDFLDYYLVVQKQHQKYSFFKEQVELTENKLFESQKSLGLFRNSNKISSISKQKSLLLLQISELEIERSRGRAEISEQEALAAGAKKSSAEVKDVRNRLISLRSKVKKLNQLITQYKLELNRLDKTETRLRELERQVNLDEGNYLLYAKKLEEARITSAMDEQKIINFSVIEPALPPIIPIKPQKVLIITVSVILGCIGGLLLAFVLEYFSHTFDNMWEMEETLGCTAIASFSELNKQEIGMALQFKTPDHIVKECDRIKHHILKTLPEKNRTVLFSSSKEKEGTSTVLFNFAVTLAAAGEKVLLVDANLRAPVLHAFFKVDNTNGLSDVLVGRVPVDNVIQNTQIENLMLISAGTSQPNPLVLFQSEYFEALSREIKTRADWVLFDSPPINAYNDACVLASKTDGFIMVVKAGKTRWQVANSAVNQIKQWDAKISGAVLNSKKMHIPDWLYKKL